MDTKAKLGEIHHDYVMIDYNLRGIMVLLELIEDAYYETGIEYEDEWQIFKTIKKLIKVEQMDLKRNNDELDKLVIGE